MAKKLTKRTPRASKAKADGSLASRVSLVAVPPPGTAPDARVLDRLWGTVLSRKDADPAGSHSARLLARGTAKIAQKFGE